MDIDKIFWVDKIWDWNRSIKYGAHLPTWEFRGA